MLLIPSLTCLDTELCFFAAFHAVFSNSVLAIKTEVRETEWKAPKRQRSAPKQVKEGMVSSVGTTRAGWIHCCLHCTRNPDIHCTTRNPSLSALHGYFQFLFKKPSWDHKNHRRATQQRTAKSLQIRRARISSRRPAGRALSSQRPGLCKRKTPNLWETREKTSRPEAGNTALMAQAFTTSTYIHGRGANINSSRGFTLATKRSLQAIVK